MPAGASAIPWTRYVALGDSLTEGVGDPYRGSLRGWADRLAAVLSHANPDFSYWNLGRRSLTAKQVFEAQVERALELEPDLVSVVVGMNDLLSPEFEADSYRRDLQAIVEAMSKSEATLLMGTFPKDLPLLRLTPRSVAHRTRHRLQEASDVVLEVAAQYDAVCADAPEGWRYRMDECSIDGCHPNARGHAHIAELAFVALCERTGIKAPAFAYVDCGWIPSSLRHLRWLASQGYLVPSQVLTRFRPSA